MEKQTIVVAGALSGMGKSIARLFLKNGDNVVLNLVNMDQITEVFQELGGGENLAIVRGKIRIC
jgi:NADP-dependent 3-hydroxy acid dehydrogenase YdfG